MAVSWASTLSKSTFFFQRKTKGKDRQIDKRKTLILFDILFPRGGRVQRELERRTHFGRPQF
jgi:hypothetical protein